MHTDARTLEDGTEITGDLCIVGAGPAGISMALDWAGRSERVILLEGGGFDLSAKMQALYENTNSGREYYSLESARLHFFGGTTSHWGGLCAPFDPIDFKERSWVPLSGWPISRGDLDPYYEKAAEPLQLPSTRWDPAYWSQKRSDAPLDVDTRRFRTKMWQRSSGKSGGEGPPLHFGPEYQPEIEQAENIHLFTHANVCHMGASPNGSHVHEVTIRHFNGEEQTVRAPHFVLACGAIQNARLLLASNDQVPVGLGNEHDQVGRHFMEHPEIDSARLVTPRAQSFSFYRFGLGSWGLLQPTPRLQEEKKILNGAVRIHGEKIGPNALGTFDDWPENVRDARYFSDPDVATWEKETADTTGTETQRSYSTHKSFILNTRAEQRPRPDSRVTLTGESDALGVPRTNVHWTLSELDKRSIRLINEAVGQELARMGIGRVKLMDWLRTDDSSWPDFLTGGWHHMGTCRMAESPKNGVVDEHFTVHGMDNLHVAGSAVYPTGGCANPTLTVVAISLRLSDHLKTKIG